MIIYTSNKKTTLKFEEIVELQICYNSLQGGIDAEVFVQDGRNEPRTSART